METDHRSEGQTLLTERVGARNIARRISKTLAGLAIAYLLARWIIVEFVGEGVPSRQRVVIELGIQLILAATSLLLTSVIPIRRELLRIESVVRENEVRLHARNQDQRFLRKVQTAFDMADDESDLFDIAGASLSEASDGPAEILIADASHAHVERLVIGERHDAPGCGVTTPRSCPAVRNGQTMRFSEPNDLSTCPRLRERHLDEGNVAVCIPVNVMGTPSAVLHAVRSAADATDTELAASASALEGVAVRFGMRLGMMRAMSQSKLQADTDPLTGLLNRRAMENHVRQLRAEGNEFALAMADLDHFKDLNDTYGHDTGDRALRLFSRVLRGSVRDDDFVSRHGGEEFLIVLPGADVVSAAPVLHRLRERLVSALADAQLPSFTASLGLVDSSSADELPDLLQLADRALLDAKATGRDRVVIADRAKPPAPAPAVTA